MLTLLRNRLVQSTVKIGLIAILVITIIFMAKKITVLSQDNNRLHNNLVASNQSLTQLQSSDGKPVYENQGMELRIKELSLLYPQLLDAIHNIHLKVSRSTSVSQNAFSTHTEIAAAIKDSSTKDSISHKTFSYRDDWYSINGILTGDTQHLSITSRDTLLQVVFKGQRERPWLWIFSPRKLMQRVSLKNPGASIYFSQYITLQKRKGRKE